MVLTCKKLRIVRDQVALAGAGGGLHYVSSMMQKARQAASQ